MKVKRVRKKIKKFVKKGKRFLRRGKGLVRKGVVRSKKLARQVWADPMTKEFMRSEKKLIASTFKKVAKRVKKNLRKR